VDHFAAPPHDAQKLELLTVPELFEMPQLRRLAGRAGPELDPAAISVHVGTMHVQTKPAGLAGDSPLLHPITKIEVLKGGKWVSLNDVD
jgi:hypothetical protein